MSKDVWMMEAKDVVRIFMQLGGEEASTLAVPSRKVKNQMRKSTMAQRTKGFPPSLVLQGIHVEVFECLKQFDESFAGRLHDLRACALDLSRWMPNDFMKEKHIELMDTVFVDWETKYDFVLTLVDCACDNAMTAFIIER
jgi:hypothetical protein